MTTTTRHAASRRPGSPIRISGGVDVTVHAGGRHTTGRLDAEPGHPLVVSFADPALALAQLPQLAMSRAAAAPLLRALGRVEVRRADGTWLLRIYWHDGRVHRWWSTAGLRLLPRAAALRVLARHTSRR